MKWEASTAQKPEDNWQVPKAIEGKPANQRQKITTSKRQQESKSGFLKKEKLYENCGWGDNHMKNKFFLNKHDGIEENRNLFMEQ
jgi:hypothetical protein